jgi:hypothetical protein
MNFVFALNTSLCSQGTRKGSQQGLSGKSSDYRERVSGMLLD